VTEAEMLAFWALTLQIGHTVHGRLDGYWKKIEVSLSSLRTIRETELTRRMTYWKIRDLFEILRTNFSKYYNPSQNLALDEVIMTFKKDGFQTVQPEKKKNANFSASKCSNYGL